MSDEVIKKLLEKADIKEKEIGKIENYNNKTNLSFPLNNGNHQNLNTIVDVEEFVSILAFLISQKQNYDTAAKTLGIKSTFKWGGFSYIQWEHDIKNRVDTINIRKKKAEFKEIKNKLDELLTPEAKKEIELKKLEAMLDN